MQAEPVLQRLDVIEAKLDRLIAGPQPEVIGLVEVMRLTGCGSRGAAYRWLKKHDLHAHEWGRYRRISITNKVAQLALFPAKK